MFGYILGGAAFALVVGFLLELFNENESKAFGVAVTSGIIAAVCNWLILYLGMPSFSHPLVGGWPLLFFFNLAIATLVSLFGPNLAAEFTDRGYDTREKYTGGLVGVAATVCLLAVWGFVMPIAPPAWCNTEQVRQQIGLLQFTPATSPYPETDLNNIIRVPASVALSKAGNALSSGENVALGNYLTPNRAYIQRIQDEPYYVVDLGVSKDSWVTFRQAGSMIPGYMLVDANDQNAPVEPHFGYAMKWVPDAMWNLDLNRRVYSDFLLGRSYLIDDLDGMEVNDDLEPYYVGTLLSRALGGFQATQPSGLYSFDPQTGKGTELPLSEKPAWLDRVYSLEWVGHIVELWGLFSNHETCSWTTLGQEKLDWSSAVVIPGGLEYQFTMTSTGTEPAMTHLITVNPTTGQAVIYPMTGKTVQGIQTLMEQRARAVLNPTGGYAADSCQIHRILDTDTVYCILVSKYTATSDSLEDYSIAGYAFAGITTAMNNNLEDVAVAATFDEAAYKYQQILARTGTSADLANTQSDVQITGTVRTNTWFPHAQARGTPTNSSSPNQRFSFT